MNLPSCVAPAQKSCGNAEFNALLQDACNVQQPWWPCVHLMYGNDDIQMFRPGCMEALSGKEQEHISSMQWLKVSQPCGATSAMTAERLPLFWD